MRDIFFCSHRDFIKGCHEKIVVITGASSGLGLSLSFLFAQQGYRVFATMRDLSKKQALQAQIEKNKWDIDVLALDVEDLGSIQSCIDHIIQIAGRIDVLVNNAGFGFLQPAELASDEAIQRVHNVNYLGVVRCTKAVLPYMRAQMAGRIVNISSVGGLVGQPFNELYCAAKFAVEGFTEAIATYMEPAFNIKFTIVEPGGIRSNFGDSAMHSLAGCENMPSDYHALLSRYVNNLKLRSGSDDIYQTPEEVAQVVLACVENEKPPLRVRTSKWAEDFCSVKTKGDPTGRIMHQKLAALISSPVTLS